MAGLMVAGSLQANLTRLRKPTRGGVRRPFVGCRHWLSTALVLAACAPPVDAVDPAEDRSQPPFESPYEDSFVQIARYTLDGFRGPEFVEILDVEAVGDLVLVCAATQGFLVVERQAAALPILAARSPSAGSPRCQHVAMRAPSPGSDRVALLTNRGDEFAPMGHLTAYDLADPSEPVEIGNLLSEALHFEGVAALDDGRFVVALRADGVGIVTVSDRTNSAVQLTQLGVATDAWNVALVGETIVVADGFDGVRAMTLDGTELWHTPLDGAVKHVEVTSDRIFASAGPAGVHALDLDGALITTIDTPGSALNTAFANDHLYVADWTDARIYDMTDPSAPTLFATENIEVNAFARVLAIDAVDDVAYIGEWTGLFSYQRGERTEAPDVRLTEYGLVFPDAAPGEESARALVVENEGDAPLTIHGFEAHERFVALDDSVTVGPGDKEAIEIRFRAETDVPTTAWLALWSDDPDESELILRLEGNAYGIGVGDAIPDYEWFDVTTNDPVFLADLRGQVVVLAYFATF